MHNRMKNLFLSIALCLGFLSSSAQTEKVSNEDIVRYSGLAVAQYQILDFDNAKYSGFYGVGAFATSLWHRNSFHIGASLCVLCNYGIFEDASEMMYDFGPSARFDISKSCFINIPLNAVICNFDKVRLAGKISPAIHLFPSHKVGIFVGPQLFFDSHDAMLGMVAGLSIDF